MKFIYLDQWCWISIRDTLLGKNCDTNYLNFIKIAKKNIARKIWAFPLSIWHLEETKNTGDDNRRISLAKTQQEFADNWYISSFQHIRDPELQCAINGKTLNKDAVIHRDISGMFGTTRKEMIEEALSSVGISRDGTVSKLYEELLLKLFPTSFTNFLSLAIDYSPLGKSSQVKHLESLKELDVERKLTKYEMLMINLKDYYPSQHGLIVKNLFPQIETLGRIKAREKIVEYFKKFPSFYVDSMLLYEHVRSKQSKKLFCKNDFLDIVFLSVAIPYCDIVITERHWKRQAEKQNLGQIYNTIILDSVGDIDELYTHLS